MQNGFLLIDKEKGINSFKLVVAMRRIFNQKKVGFAGTLDPLASGLMIMALGEYTKLLPYIEKKSKTYRVKAELGKISDTFDLEGKITEMPISREKIPSRLQIEKILKEKFFGKIKQIPPQYSAVSVGGVKAYKMARKGEIVDIPEREVEIKKIQIILYDFPILELEVDCSSGTYIRTLINDLGLELATGAVVADLRRISIADWKIEDALKLDEVNLENLINAKNFLKKADLLELNEEEYQVLQKGNFIAARVKKFKDPFLAYYQGKLAGVLELTRDGKELKFKRKFNIV